MAALPASILLHTGPRGWSGPSTGQQLVIPSYSQARRGPLALGALALMVCRPVLFGAASQASIEVTVCSRAQVTWGLRQQGLCLWAQVQSPFLALGPLSLMSLIPTLYPMTQPRWAPVVAQT